MKALKRSQSGFTLIELALIIAVLGILGAVGAVKLASMSEEAKKAAADTTLANARSAFAIGIAKETDGGVSTADMSKYLSGISKTNADSFEVENKYRFEFVLDGKGNITEVGTASVL